MHATFINHQNYQNIGPGKEVWPNILLQVKEKGRMSNPAKNLLPLLPLIINLAACNPQNSLSDAEWMAAEMIFLGAIAGWLLLQLSN